MNETQAQAEFEDIESMPVMSDDDVKVEGAFATSWGFVGSQETRTAKIQTGSLEKNNLRQKDRFVGRLKEITITTWIPDDPSSKPMQHLSGKFATAEGDQLLQTWLSDLHGNLDVPNGPTVAYAWGLLQLAKFEQACFTCSMGKEKNQFLKYPTFVNTHTVDLNGNAKQVTRRPKTDESIEEVWVKLKAELKTHPAWVEPVDPRATIKPGTHLAELCKEAQAKGWPTPQDQPARWLRMVAGALGMETPPDMLRDISDDTWGEIRQSLAGRTDCPKALQSIAID